MLVKLNTGVSLKTRFKRLALTASLLLAVSGISVFALQSPASAAPSCSNGYVCLYSDTGGGGASYWIPASYGTCYSLGGGWNDITSSVRNGMPFQIRVYDNWNCTGSRVTLGAECGGCTSSYVNDLGGWPYFFNDRTSAVMFGPF